MNYREPLTKNEIREHAAHCENSNPAVYCGTYAKYMFLYEYICPQQIRVYLIQSFPVQS